MLIPIIKTQLGSTLGGIFKDENNENHYMKFHENTNQIKQAALADKIYQTLGVKTVGADAYDYDHPDLETPVLALKSKFNDNLKPTSIEDFKNPSPTDKKHLVNIHLGSILTKNHDAFGQVFDNIHKDENGDLTLVDTSGSFNFRALGEHKDYDAGADELFSMKDRTKNPASALALHKLNFADYKEHSSSLNNLSNEKIDSLVSQYDQPKEIADNLKMKRDALLYHLT